MRRFTRVIVTILTITLLVGWIAAQEKEKPPLKGVLPPNWGLLGLSEEQRRKIYGIQDEYRPKIEALEKQLQELKTKQRSDLDGILTAEQKQKLKEITTGKGPKKE